MDHINGCMEIRIPGKETIVCGSRTTLACGRENKKPSLVY